MASASNRFGWRELPQDRAQLGAQLRHARFQEPLDRRAGGGQVPPLRGGTMGFDGEHEAVWRLIPPGREGGRGLMPVEGAVYLNGCQAGARIGELLGVRQSGREEAAAPRRERPSANAHVNAPTGWAARRHPGGSLVKVPSWQTDWVVFSRMVTRLEQISSVPGSVGS